MPYAILQISLHIICTIISFYGFSAIRFEKFCDVKKPLKIQIMLIVLSFSCGYLCAQFLLSFTFFNGL